MSSDSEMRFHEKETSTEGKELQARPEGESRKKPSGKVIAIIAVVIAAVISASAYWYVNFQIPHNEAVAAFNEAADGLNERNAELDAAIADLQDLMGSGEKPLDETTLDEASAAIGEAQGAKQEVPEVPGETDEINSLAAEVEGMGDYTAQLESLKAAQTNLQNSIDQLQQVTNPTEQFVIGRLTGLPNVTGVEAATEQNDPNGNLHKDGGYTAAVYFSSDLVDQSQVYAVDGFTGIPAVGTEGGGCVEVYATVEDAEERDAYLSAFDGSVLDSGSHMVLGTCVVRTSHLLQASQQDAIEQAIVDSLTNLR